MTDTRKDYEMTRGLFDALVGGNSLPSQIDPQATIQTDTDLQSTLDAIVEETAKAIEPTPHAWGCERTADLWDASCARCREIMHGAESFQTDEPRQVKPIKDGTKSIGCYSCERTFRTHEEAERHERTHQPWMKES